MRTWLIALAVVAAVIALLWAGDKITLEGERTIYTVSCRDGAWKDRACSGRLVAADRFRFRALRAHREVIFWTVGDTGSSGKFEDCSIKDGRNWTCRANATAAQTITLQMAKGEPVPDATGRARPFHAIAKWRWYLLRSGLPVGREADQ